MSAAGEAAGGVIYEVTLRVDPAVAAAFLHWLHGHIAEMVALPGFVDARIGEVVPAPAGAVAYCCQYRLRDGDALDAYLRDHAPAMREDGLRRFGGAFSAERRVLRILAEVR